MSGPIYRDQAVLQAVIPSQTSASGELPLRHFVLWGLVLPSINGSQLSFEVAAAPGGPFRALRDDLGQPVLLPVEPGMPAAYTLPAALAAWPVCRIVSNAVEGAERQLLLVAKG